MKTIVFKPEFEKNLKELRVKTRFIKNMKVCIRENRYTVYDEKTDTVVCVELYTLKERLDFFANYPCTWLTFISLAFRWGDTPEGWHYWYDIAKKY